MGDLVAKMPGDRKFVVCNADEGDPGAFMDRSVLESDPHRVLEGMAIAAYAVGANQGYIYVRGEYPLAIHRLEDRHQAGQTGSDCWAAGIFDSPFNLRIDLRIGAGAFVCGEETALIASIEGKRGMPRPRPPYPAEKGLWGMPDADQQRRDLRQHRRPSSARGAEWFAGIGTAKSKGTKVFALAGKIRNTGLVEVPMGTPLRDDRRGARRRRPRRRHDQGRADRRPLRRLHSRRSARYARRLRIAAAQLGSIMGSGGMIVMDQTTNMVDVARFFMEFCMDESCGKCIPCRAGTVQMHRLLSQDRRRARPRERT